MENFIRYPSFERYFRSNDNFSVINIGYDNFKTVKPVYAFHVQNFYTWHFVISGKGRLEIGDKVYELSGDDCFFIPPDTKMRYFPHLDDPWEYVWFAMRGNAAAEYGKYMGFSLKNSVLPCPHSQRIKNILKRTMDKLTNDSCGYFEVLSTFYKILEIFGDSGQPRTEIQSIKELIDDSFTLTDFSVERLCLNAGFSHAQLLRLFKKEYGKTIKQYLIDKRIEFSCELLKESDLSVQSVALSCGFSDEVHFMKTFKNRIGITATEYRKM